MPTASPIQSIADLKGKTIAFQKASIAHYVLIKALKEEGLSLDDVDLAYLPPPEANVAFSQAQLDAWVVWDPFIGRTEQLEKIVRRQTYGLFPINDQVITVQQGVADMYFDLGLIPKKVDIREVVLPQDYYASVFPKAALAQR